MMKEIIDGINLSIFLILIITFIIVLPIYLYGKSFETKYFPVVSNYTAILTDFDAYNGTAKYTLSFKKQRSCVPSKSTFAWYTINESGDQERLVFKDNIPDNEALPKGQNRIYVEVSGYKPGFTFTNQKLIMSHYCHFLWPSETIINIPISSDALEQFTVK